MKQTKEEKKRFVQELTQSVENSVLRAIDAGSIPEEWDGIELRQLLADKFKEATCSHLMKGKRSRNYRNTVIVNNL